MVICLLPKVLTFCVATLIQQRTLGRMSYRLVPCPSFDVPLWHDCVTHAARQWALELGRARDGLTRIIQYAGFFGFIASAALTSCALILAPSYAADSASGLRYCMALTVSSAVAISFVINLGRIMVRAANKDSSVRMFAWAARGQLMVIASAVLLVAVLQQSKDPVVQSPGGFILVGAVVAVFGERALQMIADRAAKLIGMPLMGVVGPSDLTKIVGLSEEDISRLAEEGIETVHALALALTPRLHLHTPYPLQRICDWQNQALLLTCLGNKALLFREQFLVRGATDAQLLADELLRRLNMGIGADADPAALGAGGEKRTATCNPFTSSLLSLDQVKLEDLVKILGFGSDAQARVVLGMLSEDENIRRLRVYQWSSVESQPPQNQTAESD